VHLAPEQLIGQSVGPYRLLEVLGRGGMGVVFRAEQRSLQREVAVKLLPTSSLLDQDAQERFLTEARVVARLQHPGLLGILDCGRHPAGVWYAMDLVRGTDLEERLPRLRLLARVAETLDYVHRRGLIHRDVKPANILINEDGQPILMDFGLVKDTRGKSRTIEGTVMGTPAYMSPEQAGGELGKVGPPTDVYALGAVLYRGLTGQPPYRGTTPLNVIAKVIKGPPPPVDELTMPGVSKRLVTICEQAMAREAADRPSARALAERLTVHAREASAPTRRSTSTRRARGASSRGSPRPSTTSTEGG
jgi:serine/threonine-protein kinase